MFACESLQLVGPTLKASSHKIVKQSQTIDTDCRRQSAITTSLCEQDRRLFADFM